MSLRRTPPAGKTKTNVTKRVRSEEDEVCESHTLSLETVLHMMNSQFEKTLARIEEMNSGISAKIDSVKAELDDKLDAVSRDISSFKSECAEKFVQNNNAMLALNNRVDEISREIGGLKNRNELIVGGIPYLKDENLALYFSAMWKQVGLPENSLPSVDIRRMKSSTKNDSLIIIQFALRNNRDDFYSSYLRQHDLQLCHLGIDSPRRIYINENLTVESQRIKAAALRLKKAGKLSSVFTKLGTVYVKRSNDQQPEIIRTEDQLVHYT